MGHDEKKLNNMSFDFFLEKKSLDFLPVKPKSLIDLPLKAQNQKIEQNGQDPKMGKIYEKFIDFIIDFLLH